METLTDAREFVTSVRREAVTRVEALIGDLEGKVVACMSGPVEIPRAGSGMVDAWARIRHELGTYAGNFQVRGERLFVKSRRGQAGAFGPSVGVLVDTLDGYLERYDPGSVNVNDALEAFCQDLAAIASLREQRGAIMRDGMADARLVAESDLELAALQGSFAQAVQQVEAIHLDSEQDCSSFVDMVDPVGIKEIADRLYVKRRTVDQWLQRGILPAPRWTVGGRPAWNWPDIKEWSLATGRDENPAKSADLEEF